MRLRLFVLSFALVNLAYNGIEYAGTARSEPGPEILSGEDMMRILPGNTLLGYDDTGPFWMYYPAPGTLWGQSSSGDVDVGSWWIENGHYCRGWRRWYDGAIQCWLLAIYDENRIVWMDPNQSIQGESLVQSGNTIGTARPSLLASLATDIAVEPIAVTGAIGPERRSQTADRSTGSGGGSSGSGGTGGTTGESGGSSGGSGGSNGGASSGGGSSGGGSSGGDDNGGGGSDGGSGKGKGGGKGGEGGKGKS